jgi:hypothetical protein
MAADISTLCDAVTTFLNGEAYTETFTATRANSPTFDMEESAVLQVTVFPGDINSTLEDRATYRKEYGVYIVIESPATTVSSQDDVMNVAQEIEESLQNQAMGNFDLIRAHATDGARVPFIREQVLSSGRMVILLDVGYVKLA